MSGSRSDDARGATDPLAAAYSALDLAQGLIEDGPDGWRRRWAALVDAQGPAARIPAVRATTALVVALHLGEVAGRGPWTEQRWRAAALDGDTPHELACTGHALDLVDACATGGPSRWTTVWATLDCHTPVSMELSRLLALLAGMAAQRRHITALALLEQMRSEAAEQWWFRGVLDEGTGGVAGASQDG